MVWDAAHETLERPALERLALERMRTTLARVLTNPRYAAHLGGVAPADIRTLPDWRRLPLLTKEILRDGYP
ncbi:MAG: phenylacetate--CoA ligase, partial [Candidatus Rokubacteria bacterium]|nr:phenylacetate--CoA ligase [Candidatus Rokubacteria bacterium]